MSSQKTRDTTPELALRRELHRRGLRYRLHRVVVPGERMRPDIVFTSSRIAVEVRGCFWHGCPSHATIPKTNTAWWREKLETNIRRDERNRQLLQAAGWELVVVWEHDDISTAADGIEALIGRRRPSGHRQTRRSSGQVDRRSSTGETGRGSAGSA